MGFNLISNDSLERTLTFYAFYNNGISIYEIEELIVHCEISINQFREIDFTLVKRSRSMEGVNSNNFNSFQCYY